MIDMHISGKKDDGVRWKGEKGKDTGNGNLEEGCNLQKEEKFRKKKSIEQVVNRRK